MTMADETAARALYVVVGIVVSVLAITALAGMEIIPENHAGVLYAILQTLVLVLGLAFLYTGLTYRRGPSAKRPVAPQTA